MLIDCMSKEARQRAGLGNPPAPYYTNITLLSAPMRLLSKVLNSRRMR